MAGPIGLELPHTRSIYLNDYCKIIILFSSLNQQFITWSMMAGHISMIKCMKMLGNSLRGLIPTQKRCLYRSCVLPITLYGFQMWYYNKVPLLYLLKVLRNMQRRAVLWILGAFHTSPSTGIEAIAGLIPIHLHLQKLNGIFHLRVYTLQQIMSSNCF